MAMQAVVQDVGRRGRRMAPGQKAAARQMRIPQPKGDSVNSFPYYSFVRFQWTITNPAPGVTLYTLAAGQVRRAFGYAIGDDLAVAGYQFGANNTATELETNLVNKSQTNSGQTVRVMGMSLYVTADSDAWLVRGLAERTSVTLGMNGEENKFRMGRMGFLPGAGGLVGGGTSSIIRPGVLDQYQQIQYGTNGLPGRENYYPLPFNLIWQKAGRIDSTLVMLLELKREISFSVTARAAGGGGGDPQIEAWAPPQAPGDLGTYVDVGVRLHTVQVAKRSVNQ